MSCCNKTGTEVPPPAHCCPTSFCHPGLLNLPTRRKLHLVGTIPGKSCLSKFDPTSNGFVVGDGDGQKITNQPVVQIPYLRNLILGADGRPVKMADGRDTEDIPPGFRNLVVADDCGTQWRIHGTNGMRQRIFWDGCNFVMEADLSEAELADFESIPDGTDCDYREAVLVNKGGGTYALGYRQTKTRVAGEVFMFAGPATRCPQDCLVCDGSAYDPAEWPALYAAIGYGWGRNGSSFRVPDMRGTFPRGVDAGSGYDPDAAGRSYRYSGGNSGDAVGSYQDDALKQHGHEAVNMKAAGSAAGTDEAIKTNTASLGGTEDLLEVGDVTDADTSNNETRPLNAAFNFLIYAGCRITP